MIVFGVDWAEGIGTPTEHSFPGKILSRVETAADSVIYRIEYWYEPFEDVKYPDSRNLKAGRPDWARISFDIVCPNCQLATQHSVQNNIVRPRTAFCKCGQALFTNVVEMPVFA